MKLALVRHGRTAWNHERRMQGRSDVPLDDHGREQAEAAGRLLGRAVWARVVTSPLARAHESAAIICSHLPGTEMIVDADLLERDYGTAEGMKVGDAHEQWPQQDYPGAEPLIAVAHRMAGTLHRLLSLPGSTIVVSHGTALRIGLEAVTDDTCPRIINGEVLALEEHEPSLLRARRLHI
ncbi:histidine phosphatase family protein [Vibrio cholerae]|nr:histidine phosphatase family protein [Vibrio cholerae]